MAKRDGESEVTSITSARRGLGEDLHDRTVRYLVSMGVRTVCLVMAVLVSGPWQWAFVAGAVIIPSIAVMAANAGRERAEQPSTYLDGDGAEANRPELTPLPYDPRTEYLR